MADAVGRQTEALESPAADQSALEWQGLPPALSGLPTKEQALEKAEMDSAYARGQAERFAAMYDSAGDEVAAAVGRQAAERNLWQLGRDGERSLTDTADGRLELLRAGKQALHALTGLDRLDAADVMGNALAEGDAEKAALVHSTLTSMTRALGDGINALSAADRGETTEHTKDQSRQLLESMEAPPHDQALDSSQMLQNLLWEQAKVALQAALAAEPAPWPTRNHHERADLLIALADTDAVKNAR